MPARYYVTFGNQEEAEAYRRGVSDVIIQLELTELLSYAPFPDDDEDYLVKIVVRDAEAEDGACLHSADPDRYDGVQHDEDPEAVPSWRRR